MASVRKYTSSRSSSLRLHDGGKIPPAQPLTVDLSKQRRDRFGRLGLRNRSRVAVGHLQLGKGILRQPQLATTHNGHVIDHVDRGQDAVAVGMDLHLGQRLESFGTHHRTIPVQVGHVLVVSVDGDALEREALRLGSCRIV
jgi:hypothetical protein